MAHVLEAAAVHEVDDELELVEDFEVGDLGLVAGFDEGLEAGLDERGGAAAEDGLLAEEVGLGLFGEGGFEDAGAGAADALGVAESALARALPLASCSTATRAGTPPPSVKTSRTRWPGALGATSETSTSSGGVMVRKRMLKPWANMSVLPGRRSLSLRPASISRCRPWRRSGRA